MLHGKLADGVVIRRRRRHGLGECPSPADAIDIGAGSEDHGLQRLLERAKGQQQVPRAEQVDLVEGFRVGMPDEGDRREMHDDRRSQARHGRSQIGSVRQVRPPVEHARLRTAVAVLRADAGDLATLRQEARHHIAAGEAVDAGDQDPLLARHGRPSAEPNAEPAGGVSRIRRIARFRSAGDRPRPSGGRAPRASSSPPSRASPWPWPRRRSGGRPRPGGRSAD